MNRDKAAASCGFTFTLTFLHTPQPRASESATNHAKTASKISANAVIPPALPLFPTLRVLRVLRVFREKNRSPPAALTRLPPQTSASFFFFPLGPDLCRSNSPSKNKMHWQLTHRVSVPFEM